MASMASVVSGPFGRTAHMAGSRVDSYLRAAARTSLAVQPMPKSSSVALAHTQAANQGRSHSNFSREVLDAMRLRVREGSIVSGADHSILHTSNLNVVFVVDSKYNMYVGLSKKESEQLILEPWVRASGILRCERGVVTNWEVTTKFTKSSLQVAKMFQTLTDRGASIEPKLCRRVAKLVALQNEEAAASIQREKVAALAALARPKVARNALVSTGALILTGDEEHKEVEQGDKVSVPVEVPRLDLSKLPKSSSAQFISFA